MSVRCLVVGFGSAGSRHAGVLAELGAEVAVVSRRQVAFAPRFPDLAAALAGFAPDRVVVATDTADHGRALRELAALGFEGPVLVEKPLVADPAELPGRAASIAVGYNLRFHPLLLELRRRLGEGRAVSAAIRCGSWLPSWRPGRDHRATASGSRARGGGVLRDLSHELDYGTWLLGPWTRVMASGGRSGVLGIDVEDHVDLLLATAGCASVTVHLDYLDRLGTRTVEVVTGEATYRLDLKRGRLEESGRDPVEVPGTAVAETYRAQARAWLADGAEGSPLASCRDGAEVVGLIAAAERSLAEGQPVRRPA